MGKKGSNKSVMRIANEMADRHNSSRHQRRKMEKLAKKYPDQFAQAAAKFEDTRGRK